MLLINTAESSPGFFIVNVKHVSLFFSVSIVDLEQVNVFQGALSRVNIITQSLKMIRCFI